MNGRSTTALLVLVPTPLEQSRLSSELQQRIEGCGRLERCGFGFAVAAARTAALLAELRPQHVLLIGLAGRLDRSLGLGEACEFRRVACYGVGAGAGSRFRSLNELGWMHWSEEPTIGDLLELAAPVETCGDDPFPAADLLLSCCAASDGPADVADKLSKWPGAAAEDMEGFAVATACRLAGNVPLSIIRGFSNEAGDRAHDTWQIDPAMKAVSQLSLRWIERHLAPGHW